MKASLNRGVFSLRWCRTSSPNEVLILGVIGNVCGLSSIAVPVRYDDSSGHGLQRAMMYILTCLGVLQTCLACSFPGPPEDVDVHKASAPFPSLVNWA